MPRPGELVRTCPYCFASPTPFTLVGGQLGTTGAEGQARARNAATCPACGGVVVFEQGTAGEHPVFAMQKS